MRNDSQLEILGRGVANWNEWRKANPEITVDLDDADLSGRSLAGVNFSLASMRGVNLSRADLIDADLSRADMVEAILTRSVLARAEMICTMLFRADLRGSALVGADLTGADATQADLSGADLARAILTDCDLSGATFGRTAFQDVDLTDAIGLLTTRHDSSSSFDWVSLARTVDKVPRQFFRNAGLPESLLDFLPKFVAAGADGKVVKFHSCFISHAHQDQEFVDKLYKDLWNGGVSCWNGSHNLTRGAAYKEQIYEAVNLNEKVIIVISLTRLEAGG